LQTKTHGITNIPIVTHYLSPKFDHIYVVPLSDWQVGEWEFDEDALRGYIDWIMERKNAFTILPGDIFSQHTVGNKASNFYDMALTPKESRDKIRDLLKPLIDAKKILAAIPGNHESRAYRLTGHDPLMELLQEMGFPVEGKKPLYAPKAVAIRIIFGTDKSQGNRGFTYKIYMTHGWGGARRTGAHVNKTEELASVVTNADVYLIGHEHTLYSSRWDNATIPDSGNASECKHVRQLFVGAGTFCRYTDFQKGIQRRLPNIGAPRIRFEGSSGHRTHKDIHVSI
jgi:hypothetical protein